MTLSRHRVQKPLGRPMKNVDPILFGAAYRVGIADQKGEAGLTPVNAGTIAVVHGSGVK